MNWFRKRSEATVEQKILFGALRIAKTWSGRYVIQEYGARLMGAYHLLEGWWEKEDAGSFDTPQAAIDRIRFMGKFDLLMTGEAS